MTLRWDCSKGADERVRLEYSDGAGSDLKTGGGAAYSRLTDGYRGPVSNRTNFAWQLGDTMGADPPRAGNPRDICNYPSPYGPPRLREGKVGGCWRHVRETVGQRGQCIMFVEGTVKIRDSCPTSQECTSVHGIPVVQVDVPPPPTKPYALPPYEALTPQLIRRPRVQNFDTHFAEHARNLFVYWYEDPFKKKRCSVPAWTKMAGQVK